MKVRECFECEQPAVTDHHVIPRSKGGRRTVPLCQVCHDLVHDLRPRLMSTSGLTRAALAAKRKRGEYTGTAPYGYRLATDGVRLEVDAAEAHVLAQARELRASGLSLRLVAAELAARGHLSRTGRPFAAVQIARMVNVIRVDVRATPFLEDAPA